MAESKAPKAESKAEPESQPAAKAESRPAGKAHTVDHGEESELNKRLREELAANPPSTIPVQWQSDDA